MRGSGCGLGWDGASSGRTGLRVDATGGAQDGVGCHSRDTPPANGLDRDTTAVRNDGRKAPKYTPFDGPMVAFSLAVLDCFVLDCLPPDDNLFDEEESEVDGPATGLGASAKVPS